MLNYFVVGKPIPRVDAIEKVTGKAIYIDDLMFPNLLYGKVLRSKFAHAKILHLDTSKAEKFPGVKAVVTGKEFATNFDNPLVGSPLADQPFLAVEKVRYIGEPIAVVAAINQEIAEDALDLIRVEYEQLPAVLNVEDALKNDRPLVHESFNNFRCSPGFKPVENSNICCYIEITNGNIEQGFREADFIFEDIFTTHSTQHVPMECHVAIAQFNPDDSITIWAPDQSPYGGQNLISAALKIPESRVRIITPPYIGGGFGGKLNLSGLMPIVAIAWKTNYRPVKIVLTREEEFVSTTIRHSSIIKLKSGVKKDGTIISRYAKLMFDTGAYADIGPIVLGKAATGSLGPYKIPHIKVEGYCVYTNKAIAGAYRGFGIPQVCWAYESQMDIIADKLGINSIDIRLKNIVEEGYITPTEKQEAHAVGLGKCLIKVRENMSQKGEGKIIENRKRGKGVACGYKTAKTPSGANAFVKLNSDAGADIFVSSVEMGQGVNTIFAQIVAEELSIPFNNIRVLPADTNITPFFPASNASRVTFYLGNAVKKAAQDIKEQLFKIAKDILQADKEDLALEQGLFFVKKEPKRKVKIMEIMKKTYPGGISILGRGTYYQYKLGSFPSHVKVEIPTTEVWMYASQGVEVEVDTETGRVKILKVVAVHDVGKAINPITCEGQIEGGVLMALSNAMFEELLFNEKGKILNSSLLDYKIPSALDMPEIKAILVEEAHREGPYGAKGLGEMVAVPTAPAIANAICDAVGIRIKDLPITPDKLLRALKNKCGDCGV
ncbi:MAG: xanthine dehydrogenase family protein molybdopterin-binding subunit [Actinobacteria bacterium]|nr:xanthine dehydrogenase family protein molybdopterin-binding subunit [Actinomycetota bacterium]